MSVERSKGKQVSATQEAGSKLEFRAFFGLARRVMDQLLAQTYLYYQPVYNHDSKSTEHVFYRVKFQGRLETHKGTGNLCIERYLVTADAIGAALQEREEEEKNLKRSIKDLEARISVSEAQILTHQRPPEDGEYTVEEVEQNFRLPSLATRPLRQRLKKLRLRLTEEQKKEKETSVEVRCPVVSVAVMKSANLNTCLDCGARQSPPLVPGSAQSLDSDDDDADHAPLWGDEQRTQTALHLPVRELRRVLPPWLKQLLPSAHKPLFYRTAPPHNVKTNTNSVIDVNEQEWVFSGKTDGVPNRKKRYNWQVLWSTHENEQRLLEIPLPHMLANVFACLRNKNEGESPYVIARAPVVLVPEDQGTRTWRLVGAIRPQKGKILALTAFPKSHKLLILYKTYPTRSTPDTKAKFKVFEPSSAQFTEAPRERIKNELHISISRVDKLVCTYNRVFVAGIDHQQRWFVAHVGPGEGWKVQYFSSGAFPQNYAVAADSQHLYYVSGDSNLALRYSFATPGKRPSSFPKHYYHYRLINPSAVMRQEGELVLMGGYRGFLNTQLNQAVFVYKSPVPSAWIHMIRARSSHPRAGAAALVFKDKIYLFGGEPLVNTAEVYNESLEEAPILQRQEVQGYRSNVLFEYAHPVVL